MLRQLSIRAFALIDKVDIDVERGMTVLIGETGAGKSIIIDALSCALGARMSSDMVRKGAKKCVIEATFDASAYPEVSELLDEHGLSWDSNELILRRELTDSGTSRCFVNDTPTTAAVVRDLAGYLMDFHGQHDTHGLLNASRHRSVVDAFAGLSAADLGAVIDDMRNAWSELTSAEKSYAALHARSESAGEERARLEFILKEINDIDPQNGEDVSIAADLRRSESSEQVIAAASAARSALYVDESSAYEMLRQARDRIRELLPYDPQLQATLDDVEAAMTTCKEGAAALSTYSEGEEDFSPERLEALRQRQAALQRLIRKYGSIDDCNLQRAEFVAQLNQLENLDEELDRLRAAVEKARSSAERIAKELTKRRKAHVGPLSQSMTATLRDLGMPAAVVDVSLTKADLGPHGTDAIEFLFSANAGEEPKPLSKIASGGELSRFMLALKKALSDRGVVGTMIFDEIDTGISGRVARQVGMVMKQIATAQQVICITHLPQIASLADRMIGVRKDEAEGRSSVSAYEIDHEGSVREVARLMSGATITEAAIDGARELIAEGMNNGTR